MYWYNPKTRTSERSQAPSTDEQAIRMLDGHKAFATLVSEYAKLRRSGTPIESALVLVGHEERLSGSIACRCGWRSARSGPEGGGRGRVPKGTSS
jgi:hypothetical protein